MSKEQRLEELRAKLAASEGQEGYADRVKAIREEIAKLEQC